MWVRSLDWEDPLQEEMATHSRILAWKISWTEEPSRVQSTGLQSDMTETRTHTCFLYISFTVTVISTIQHSHPLSPHIHSPPHSLLHAVTFPQFHVTYCVIPSSSRSPSSPTLADFTSFPNTARDSYHCGLVKTLHLIHTTWWSLPSLTLPLWWGTIIGYLGVLTP